LFAALLLIFYALSHSAEAGQPLDPMLGALLLAAIAFLIVFYFIERRAAEPVIPLDLFHTPFFKTSIAVATLAAMGVFGAISYLPLYLQGVSGLTASRAGMVLLFLSGAWTVGSLIAGQATGRAGYRAVTASGMMCMLAGYGLFVFFRSELTVRWVIASATLIGTGMGLANLTTLVAAQNSVSQQRIGVATSTVMLFRTFGGAFAVSLMGTLLLHRMQGGLGQLSGTGLSETLLEKLANPQNLLDPAMRAQLSPEILPRLIGILGDALWHAFLAGFLLMAAGAALSLFMSANKSGRHGTQGRSRVA
jgi:hypothetical protein